MALLKFESMLKTNSIYFFDLVEFEEIIVHYLDCAKLSLAKKALNLGLEQHPESIDLKLLNVELLIADNKIHSAENTLKTIERLDPENEEIYIQKAAINSKKGQHKQAIANLQIALKLTTDNVDVWSLLGMEYLYIDDFKNACKNFINCIEEDVEDYGALYNIMYCFDMEKNHIEAIDFLKKYIDRNPYCEIAWHQLGKQYFIVEDFNNALNAFDYAIIIEDHFIGGYLEKAKTQEQLGLFEDAIDNYLITLELDDATAYAYLRIGCCFERIGQYKNAINYFKKAVHEDPLLDKAWFLLTKLYFKKGNLKKASHTITKTIEIEEDNAAYWTLYGHIQKALKNLYLAVHGFTNSLNLKDYSVENYIGLADVYLEFNILDNALDTLTDAVTHHKNNAEISYRLVGLLFLDNRIDLAFTMLNKALEQDFKKHILLYQLYPKMYTAFNLNTYVQNFK